MTPLDEAVVLIRDARCVAIACHVAPDGDAIGSLLALGRVLEGLGKQVALLCDDTVPHKLQFLPGTEQIRSSLPGGFVPDLFVGLDSSDLERLGVASQQLLNSDVSTINIDHHMTNLNFGAVNLVQAERASTAEILLQLIDALDVQLDEPTAICLLAGVVTDTQGFTTANVTPATLEAASRLVAAGADLAYIANMAYSRRSLPALRLWGIGLANMRLEEGILWTTLSRAARRAEGLDEVTDRGLSSLLISADEANIAAVFQEKPDGRIEISLRARPGYDVASVALALGGGGHLLAAGATIDGPLDEAVKLVIGMLKTQVLSEQTEVPTPEG